LKIVRSLPPVWIFETGILWTFFSMIKVSL
jgi:hypothetical protein